MDALKRHMENVAEICRVLGTYYGIGITEKQQLEIAASYHDIGKKYIHTKLFTIKRKLSEAEYEILKKHSEIGANMLEKYGFEIKIVEAVRHHHEWWNGGGYPAGKKGLEIPLFARMISVADAYDAMTSGRPYRKAVSPAKAVDELLRCAGSQFDPDIVDLLVTTKIHNVVKIN